MTTNQAIKLLKDLRKAYENDKGLNLFARDLSFSSRKMRAALAIEKIDLMIEDLER